MQIENLKKGIINELPQIPFIIDQVGDAIAWAEEVLNEGELIKTLKVANTVANWVATISDPNFYKTHLVIASILADIPDAMSNERFLKFDSLSKSVENTLQSIKVNSEETKSRGCFNALTIHLVQLARKDEEALAIMLYKVLNDLEELIVGIKSVEVKTPITPEDYVTVLGYALVMANIRMSNLSLLNYNQELLNQINIILNNDVIY